MWHPPSGGMFSLMVGVNAIAHASLVRTPHEKWTLDQRRRIIRRLLAEELRLSVSEEEDDEEQQQQEEAEQDAEQEGEIMGARKGNDNDNDVVNTPMFSPEAAAVDSRVAQDEEEEESDSTVSSRISGVDDLSPRLPIEWENMEGHGSNGSTAGDVSSESVREKGGTTANVPPEKRKPVDRYRGNDDGDGDGSRQCDGSNTILQVTAVRKWEGIGGRFTRDTATDKRKARRSTYALR